MFSDSICFRHFYDGHNRQIAALKAIADAHKTLELLDDGPHSAPSKRIIAEIPDYESAKPAIEPQLAELIGLEIIRDNCPH